MHGIKLFGIYALVTSNNEITTSMKKGSSVVGMQTPVGTPFAANKSPVAFGRRQSLHKILGVTASLVVSSSSSSTPAVKVASALDMDSFMNSEVSWDPA